MENFQIIEENLLDESRIITYRWLSLTLQISSNYAKIILDDFHRKQKNVLNLCATYFLSGRKYDDKIGQDIHKVCIVPDTELKAMESKFKEIFSVHIYSIQKCKLKDPDVLYGVDFDIISKNLDRSTEFSSIKCESAKVKRTRQDVPIEPLKESSPVVIKTENKENLSSNDVGNKKSFAMFSNQNSNDQNKKSTCKPKNLTKSVPMKNPLSSFLMRGPLQQSKSISPKIECPKIESLATKSPKKEGLATKSPKKENFATPELIKEENSPILEKTPKEKIETYFTEEEKGSELKNINDSEREKESEENNKNSQKLKNKKGVKNSQKSKKRKSNHFGMKDEVKRKRIVQPFDSSSEDSENQDREDILDEDPRPSLQKNISSDDESFAPKSGALKFASKDVAAENFGGKRKKRKVVDKTFMDEDGFLVTKKEVEMVSDSDCEITSYQPQTSPKKSNKLLNPEKSKNSAKSPKKCTETKASPKKSAPKKRNSASTYSSPTKNKREVKKKSPTKRKQSSITSFFQKK